MRTPIKRSLILSSAIIATLTLGGAATAGAIDGPTDRAAANTTNSEGGPVVETEKGIVLEGFGNAGKLEAAVTVYENNRYGNSVQIVLGDPDDDLFGVKEKATPFVNDGQLRARVNIAGYAAVLKGTVAENGPATEIRDSLQDAGMRIVTKGTNTPLLVEATLAYRGKTYQLSFDPAFAYDLQVKKVTLYGR